MSKQMLSSVMMASVVLAGAATGCVISPASGDLVPTTVQGLSTISSGTIHVNAMNWTTNAFVQVGTGTAGSSAIAAAGTLCSNSPALYFYSVTPTFTSNNFKAVGTTSVIVDIQAQQIVPSTGETQTLFSTNNPNGVQCVEDHITPGCDFYTVTYTTCGYNLTDFTVANPG